MGRVTRTGVTVEDPGQGLFGYGVPVEGTTGLSGTLTVTGGATHLLTASAATPVTVTIGAGTGRSGSVAVAEAGSTLSVASATSAEVTVGKNGADGALYVLGGASVALSGAGGSELRIGDGGRGLADVLGGTLTLAGADPTVTLGGNGGDGRMRLLDSGRLQLSGTEGSDSTLRIGAGGEGGGAPLGIGRLMIGDGAAIVSAGAGGTAQLRLGSDGGTGILDIATPGSAPNPAWGLVVNGHGGGAEAVIGRGGNGTLRIEGGRLALRDDGSLPAPDLSAQPQPGRPGGPVTLTLGGDGGTALVDASRGARIELQGSDGARIELDGGEVLLRDATLDAHSAAGSVLLRIGAAGEAALRLDPGSLTRLQAATEAHLELHAAGRLEADGASLQLSGDSATVSLAAGSLALLQGGAELSLSGNAAALQIAGTLQASGASLTLAAATAGVEIAADGALVLQGGASLTSTGAATLQIDGLLRLAGAELLQAGGDILVDGQLWLDGGTLAGAALIAGAGLIHVGGSLTAGTLALEAGGRLVLSGGTVAAGSIALGAGAELAGAGRLDGNVMLTGASLRAGVEAAAGPAAMLDVTGDLIQTGGTLRLDAGPEGDGLITVTGHLGLSDVALSLGWHDPDGAALADRLTEGGVLLARAEGGITLSGVTAEPVLELRAGATELWAVAEPSAPPSEPGPPPQTEPEPEPDPAPPATVTLSGQITVGGAPLSGVSVTFSPSDGPAQQVLTEGGAFGFDLPPGSDGVLSASLPGAPPPTSAGAISALRLALGLDPARPDKLIAADITGDGRVSIEDAIAILRSALGLSSPHQTRWVFVETEALEAMPTTGWTPPPAGLALEVGQDSSLELTAILVGHPHLLA